jgi:hypothetical protein
MKEKTQFYRKSAFKYSFIPECSILHTEILVKKRIVRRDYMVLKLYLVCDIFFILLDWWLLCNDRNIAWYQYQGHENNCHI